MAFEAIGVRAVIEGIAAFNRDADIINRRLKEVTGNLEDVPRAAKKSSRGLRDLEHDLTTTGIALSAVGAAGTALVFSSTRLAARVETLGVVTAVLGRNVGKTEPEIRELEESIQDLGITILGSRQAIAKMIGSNVDLAHATDLARLAQNAAVVADIDSTEAFERLIDVITSGNVLMARNLGLQVSFERAYQATAESIGKTTGELTELERVQARTTAVLAAGVNIADAYEMAMTTVGKAVTSLPRHLQDSQVVLGQAWLPVYAEAVALITASLVKWKKLNDVQQNLISTGLGATSITIGLAGGLALAAAKLPGLIAAFGSVGAAVGLSAGAFAIVVVAIAAVLTAGVKLLAFIKDTKEQSKKLKEELSDFHSQLLLGTNNYDEYRREVDRVNQVIKDQGVLGRVLTRELDAVSEAEFQAAQEAARLEAGQTGAAGAMTDADAAAAEAAQGFEDMAAAEAEATRKAENLAAAQEMLKGKLAEIELQISTDITPQFEDFQDKLAGLNDEIAGLEAEKLEAVAELKVEEEEEITNLQERIADLSNELEIAKLRFAELGSSASEATRLAAETRVERLQEDLEAATDPERIEELNHDLEIATLRLRELGDAGSAASRLSEQIRIDELTADLAEAELALSQVAGSAAEDLAALDSEYAERMGSIRGEIEDTTEAWSQQTKEIIFNLATQRLGIGGFTEEELRALTTLAGPEGLGLIDEAGVALLTKIDELNTAMSAAGDQSELFAEDMGTLARLMADPTQSAEDLAAAIRDVGSALIESLPTPRFATDPFARIFGGGPAPVVSTRRQFGGRLGRGQAGIVGEGGRELFIPDSAGRIIPNRLLSALESMVAALPIAAPTMATASAGAGVSNFNMTVNTSAPVEPIAADFNLLALMGERRG